MSESPLQEPRVLDVEISKRFKKVSLPLGAVGSAPSSTKISRILDTTPTMGFEYAIYLKRCITRQYHSVSRKDTDSFVKIQRFEVVGGGRWDSSNSVMERLVTGERSGQGVGWWYGSSGSKDLWVPGAAAARSKYTPHNITWCGVGGAPCRDGRAVAPQGPNWILLDLEVEIAITAMVQSALFFLSAICPLYEESSTRIINQERSTNILLTVIKDIQWKE
ncbi:hypothetical protein HZH66_005037 [Vespula vulgaris]|uniref:Uncharacterized protein n=1 Tax=Vespula vulgaris TaxID=7454 RepID=A0A834NBE9_VESVU|nr:hypothetical protein HZH66_005037 [Vespula vulgaris]